MGFMPPRGLAAQSSRLPTPAGARQIFLPMISGTWLVMRAAKLSAARTVVGGLKFWSTRYH